VILRPWLLQLGGLVVTATTTPTLAVANDGDGAAVTATITGADAGATIQLLYRLTSASAWTVGSTRSGNGTIAQSGLSGPAQYEFIAYATVSSIPSTPSVPVILTVYDSTSAITSSMDAIRPEQRIREILAQWLTAYFDGAAHEVGGSVETFPDCEIIPHYVMDDAESAKPIIGIRINDEGVGKAFWNTYTATTSRTPWRCDFYVCTTVKSSGSAPAAIRARDRVSDLLRALLTRKATELATAGLRRPDIAVAINIEMPKAGPARWVKMRSVTFESDLVFEG